MTMNNLNQMQTFIQKQISDSIKVAEKLAETHDVLSGIDDAANVIIHAFSNRGKVLIAGNGGSAADAQHIAAEFVNRFFFDRDGLPAIALTTDTSVLTSVSNDYGFERIFARQLNALGNEGDIFIAISTSGNSPNIIEALKECRKKGIKSIGLTGSSGGQMKDMCDILIKVPSDETPRIQEMHILMGHIICFIVEDTVFRKPDPDK